MSSSKRNWFAFLEALSVFAMILLYIWKLRFFYPYSWIIIFVLLLASHAFRRETPATLGFDLKNLQPIVAVFTPFVLVLALTLLALGSACRTIRHITPESGFSSLVLYCVWGLFQQYILNGYFVNRLAESSPGGAP